ncbi:SpoIIE family protein phosphatase [Streptomyces sp. NPDC048650]|uniref:SpoIIE family protein phosphatase n=1 Tax=Streptomyces sp. NPDC048650 TaxID=3365583 RepID=UPI00371E56A5
MDQSRHQESRFSGTDGARLTLLDSACTAGDLDEVELLRLALEQAVAAAGALGGVAHLGGPATGKLQLAALGGLPQSVARPWEALELDGPAAPARAARERRPVWVASRRPDDTPSADGAPEVLAGVGAAGALALPLPGANGPAGTLALLTAEAPDADRLRFLTRLAEVTGEALTKADTPAGGLLPWWTGSGSRLREAMAGVRVATWEWDLVTGELLLDDAALETIAGVAGLYEWDSRVETWMQRVHPDDLAGVLSAIKHAIAAHEVYSVEYRVRALDGRVGWVELRGHTTYAPDGTPLRMTGTGWDTTATRMTEQVVTRVLGHMPDAFLIVDPADWRVLYANSQAQLLGSEPVALVGRAPWEAVAGLEEGELKAHFEEAVRSDRPLTAVVQVGETWQRLRLVVVEPYLVVYVADVTAEVDAERAAAERARRISALTDALAQALTTQDVVDAVAAQILPPFGANGVLVHAMTDDRLRLVGAVGYPPDLLERLRHQDAGALLADRAPRFLSSAAELVHRYPALAGLADADGALTWAMLPLVASGRHVGSCLLAFDRPQPFSNDNGGLLIALSGLVAQALERARLYDSEHNRARQLQQHLLPSLLPELPALSAAARYRPAGDHCEVGGDWYDTIPLSAERVALVIGDVMGHGLREAITMSRLRTAVSTLSTLDHPPEEMLAHLNDIAGELGDDQYVTCLYAVYDPTTGVCTLASAGHPPPAVVPPGGRPYFVDLEVGPPLGTAQMPYRSTQITLPEGSLLVLYTDGLVCLAGSDPGGGLAGLAGVLATAAPGQHGAGARGPGDDAEWLQNLCDTVTQALPRPAGHPSDDAAILAARVHRLPAGDIASWDLPFEPSSAGTARKLIRGQLTAWGLPDLIMPTELIVSELIGNTVRHATGPVGLRLIRGTTLTCEVYDGSQSAPRVRHAALMDESGRGLQLVGAMAHRWGTRYTSSGSKTLWTEQLIP